MSVLKIPYESRSVRYNGAAHPAAPFAGLSKGANCQRFVFELLRYFGYEIGPLRSSDLWKDQTYTRSIGRKRPLDILMFNRKNDPRGAHLALYLGNGRSIHVFGDNHSHQFDRAEISVQFAVICKRELHHGAVGRQQ